MLQLSICFLFVSNLPGIFGPLHAGETSNELEVDKAGDHLKERGYFQAISGKTTPESHPDHGNVIRSGQKLEGCFGATGRWLSQNLYKKKDSTQKRDSTIKKTCTCKGSNNKVEYWVSRSQNSGGKLEACSLLVTREGSVGGANAGSAELSSQKPPNSPTETPGTALYTRQSAVSSNVQQNDGRMKKTYRSKKSRTLLPKTSAKGPPECSCKKCFGRGWDSCYDYVSMFTFFFIAWPFIAVACICLHSCDPCIPLCNELPPPEPLDKGDTR